MARYGLITIIALYFFKSLVIIKLYPPWKSIRSDNKLNPKQDLQTQPESQPRRILKDFDDEELDAR